MVDEVIRKIEALGLSNESTAHPEIHAILRDIGGILRVLYDAVVETGTDARGAIPVVTMTAVKMEAGPLSPDWSEGKGSPVQYSPEADSKESTPKGEE